MSQPQNAGELNERNDIPAFIANTSNEAHAAAILAALVWNTPELLSLGYGEMNVDEVKAFGRIIVVAASVGAQFERLQQKRSKPLKIDEIGSVFGFEFSEVPLVSKKGKTKGKPIAPNLFDDYEWPTSIETKRKSGTKRSFRSKQPTTSKAIKKVDS